MNSSERRDKIITILKDSKEPISGMYIANMLNVSRQIIVGDVAILRASGLDIIATSKGYILNHNSIDDNCIIKTIACNHSKEVIEDELNIIVDEGATIMNVIVEHPIYGQLTGDLHLCSRRDVSDFMNKINLEKFNPLSDLTGGIHLHTIKCKDEKSLEQVINSLKEKGYLL